MSDKYIEIQGLRVPTFIYGTAWKDNDTARLTQMALDAGFCGIDTANQRRHYHEAGVGEALASAFATGTVKREDLFLQTKYTFIYGQDQRLPYDKNAPIAHQVEQSFASSLEHLGVSYLDSYVLHGPSRRDGLGPEDWEAWRSMESLHRSGKAKLLGVSNVTLSQLQALHRGASVKPAMVQNRCFASQGWDRAVRAFCKEHGLIYQGFSLLTANPEVLEHPITFSIAEKNGMTVAQVIFRFALRLGMIALTGTTSPAHMNHDLAVYDFQLSDAEAAELERLIA